MISVEGTPTDCVHLAITGLLETEPDMVVSGINQGSNLGDDVLYSGTVAAAIEGRFLGKPAIALSLAGSECRHFETAAIVAKMLVERLIADPFLPAGTILNVNVPDLPFAEIKGLEVTRLGSGTVRNDRLRKSIHVDAKSIGLVLLALNKMRVQELIFMPLTRLKFLLHLCKWI